MLHTVFYHYDKKQLKRLLSLLLAAKIVLSNVSGSKAFNNKEQKN